MGGGGSRTGGLANLVGGVEQRLLFEQGAGHRQQAVGDGAQGAAVAVAALAQRGITAAAERVVLGCQARPMIERVREPLIAGVTAHDDAGFAAAAGHRDHPGQAYYCSPWSFVGVLALRPIRSCTMTIPFHLRRSTAP